MQLGGVSYTAELQLGSVRYAAEMHRIQQDKLGGVSYTIEYILHGVRYTLESIVKPTKAATALKAPILQKQTAGV